jgi:hypothetical protein
LLLVQAVLELLEKQLIQAQQAHQLSIQQRVRVKQLSNTQAAEQSQLVQLALAKFWSLAVAEVLDQLEAVPVDMFITLRLFCLPEVIPSQLEQVV